MSLFIVFVVHQDAESVILTLARAAASAKAVHPPESETRDMTSAMEHTSVAVLAEEMTFIH